MDQRQLVQDCLRGKPAAQKELYGHFSPKMLGVCYRYTKSISDAEDILQDAFVKVFRNLHQYKFDGELGAWIWKIMVNTALNFLKHNQKYQEQLFFTEQYLHPVSNNDPEVDLDAKELADLIRQLPDGYQLIFNLHAIEGYSHVEISKMLGITDGTSRSQYARARALLASWIKKMDLELKNENYAGQ